MEVVIPGYKIVKVIGKGGMATVYVAVQESFNRQVALKIMARHLTGDEVFSERFFREARIIASLNHRNIVPVFDVGRAGDHHYLSMEYLPGGDLKQRLKQGIRAEEALHAIYEIATALAYAHSKSYIHRDIKPENILFREDNTVVLTDFGIAKALDTSDCNMTSTGMIVGSPHYMSPEQALAREIDTRSDIYSLGVVFYEVLVGKPLYDANSSVAAAIKHISEPIPKLPDTFSYLQPLLEKMVAKAPEDRFQSALEVAHALEPYLRAAPENWKTVVQEDFVSETEGGTRIMVRATGQHAASVATPAPLPSRTYAASAPTLHGDKDSAKLSSRVSEAVVKIEHKIEAGASSLRASLQQDRKKLGAVAAGLLLIVGVGVVAFNNGEADPANLDLVAEAQPEADLSHAVPAAIRVPAANSEKPADSVALQAKESESSPPAVEPPKASVEAKPESKDVLANYLDNLAESPAAESATQDDLAADPAVTASEAAEIEPADKSESESVALAAEDIGASEDSSSEDSAGVQIIASAQAATDSVDQEQQDLQLALLQTQEAEPELNESLSPDQQESVPADYDPTELESLLAKAKEALRRDRLMVPRKNSAYTLFQAALEMDPSNVEAKQGLDRIVAKYLILSSRQLNEGELDQAQDYADRANLVASSAGVSAEQKQEAANMLKTIERVRYLDTMQKLETWISVVKQKQHLTVDDLNSAYESYMSVLNNNYRDPKVNVAHEVYANAFFDLGKRYFKADDLEISRELIAKGLEINPEHKNLQDLNARWERKKNGDEWFMDRFY